MKLMTKAIATGLIKADRAFLASDKGETNDKVIVKYFTPWANATWFVVSGTPLDAAGEPDYEAGTDAADWHLWGFADMGDPGFAELGYVLFSELESLSGPAGLKIERDIYYDGKGLAEVMAAYKEAA